MAVTAPKKVKPAKPEEPHAGEMLEIVEVTRGYLDENPVGAGRTWQGLLEACMTDSRVEFRRVGWGDLSCAHGWMYRSDDPRSQTNKAWFRQGTNGQALLYQQAWRVLEKDTKEGW